MSRRLARRSCYHPVVSFQGPSGPATFTSSFGSRPSIYQVGQHVPVRFPPARPAAAQLDTASTSFLYWGPMIIGFVFLLMGGGLIAGAILFGGP